MLVLNTVSRRTMAVATWPRLALQPRSISMLTPTTLLRSQRPYPVTPRLERRGYASLNNESEIMRSFSSPFGEFVSTVSRIARIITFTALGAATVLFVGYEGAHQYVEFIAMPALASRDKEEWGWGDQALDESWNGNLAKSGTDSRLGIKGRHAVRSAWMCVHWGAGVSPSVLFSNSGGGLGRTSNVSAPSSSYDTMQDGMLMASKYLALAIEIAAAKKISLPDLDAVRAGIVSPQEARAQATNVDPLAIALESRKAAALERQGSRAALEAASLSYENLLEIASVTTSDPSNVARSVRLAAKIGDLKQALGQRGEAIEWAQRAVSLAGPAGDYALTAPRDAASAPAVPTPTPGLTRALITALLSLSAMYAQNSVAPKADAKISLQQALSVQSSALKLAELELDRIAAPAAESSTLPAQLHSLWLTQHRAVLGLHLAETIYALEHKAKSRSGAAIKGLFGKNADSEHTTSLQWIKQSLAQSESVIRQLALQPEAALKVAARRPDEEEVLNPQLPLNTALWKPATVTHLFAQRLGRDALRLRTTALRLRNILTSTQ